MTILLAGDIGGTKTTLALFAKKIEGYTSIIQHTYASHDFSNFNDILRDFLRLAGHHTIEAFGLSVAGPVIDGTCITTNLPWALNETDISQEFGVQKVHLINDIQATGFGLIHAHEEDLIQMNPNADLRDGHRAIVSIGTGLGEGYLFWDERQYHPVGSEGGHADFAPVDESDLNLWQYFHGKYPQHLSYERVLSGPGIQLIYEHLCEENQDTSCAPLNDTSAWISQQALNKTDEKCIKTMEIFMHFLAAEAGNLALKAMATGGVYITGGITPKILPLFHAESFMEQFTAKGRFKNALGHIPIWLNKNPEAPLIGALEAAKNLIRTKALTQPEKALS